MATEGGGNGSTRIQQAPNAQMTIQQAEFMQRKLEKLYNKTYQLLINRKDWIETIEKVLVWNLPLIAAALYIAIHFIFIILAGNENSFITQIGNLIFWSIVMDILWRAATNQFGNSDKRKKIKSFFRTSNQTKPVSFEAAIIERSTPLMTEELPAFEVVCLWIAEVVMWMDNLFIFMKICSVEHPYLFFSCLMIPGVILSILGRYIPTIMLTYILVIGALTWPYIEYHDLRSKVVHHINVYYPKALQRAKSSLNTLRSLALKDNTEFHEVSLANNGDERDVAQALHDAFEEATASNSRSRTGQLPHPSIEEPNPQAEEPPPPDPSPHVDPGMSVLQDSVLGLKPNAFLGSEDSFLQDSISIGTGNSSDFPSISDLDQSISLPQFPSRDSHNDDDLSTMVSMPSIIEEDDIILPSRADSRDLDPFTDSLELEYGGYNFTDGRFNHQTNRSPHPQSNTHSSLEHEHSSTIQPSAPTLDLIPEDAGQTGRTGSDTGYETGSLSTNLIDSDPSRYTPEGEFNPPPTYQAAVDGSDGAISSGRRSCENGFQRTGTASDSASNTKGRYWLRRRN